MQRAFEHHFTSSHKRRSKVNMKAIEELFQKYKDKDDDRILAEGVGQFCEDLEVEPEDIVMVRHNQCFSIISACRAPPHLEITSQSQR